MRSSISTGNGGRPLRPSGAYGAIKSTNSCHGTTCCICSRNSRLRVFLVERFRPRSNCCIGRDAAAHGTHVQAHALGTYAEVPLANFLIFLNKYLTIFLPSNSMKISSHIVLYYYHTSHYNHNHLFLKKN